MFVNLIKKSDDCLLKKILNEKSEQILDEQRVTEYNAYINKDLLDENESY